MLFAPAIELDAVFRRTMAGGDFVKLWRKAVGETLAASTIRSRETIAFGG
jgi:hypothetical protein